MARILRVKRFTVRNKFESWQLLQERRWWGWMTLDREDIPAHVLISLGAYADRGGWESKFAEIGSFGSDGAFTPHDPSMFERKPGRIMATFKRVISLMSFTSKSEVVA